MPTLAQLKAKTPLEGSMQETFWHHVQQRNGPLDTPCWIWTKGKNAEGRGILRVDGELTYVYRHAHKLLTGRDFPKLALHECDDTSCIRHCHSGEQPENQAV